MNPAKCVKSTFFCSIYGKQRQIIECLGHKYLVPLCLVLFTYANPEKMKELQ
jgi:hypothetical protein